MKAVHVALLLLMGFAIVVLVLNIRDRDAFEGGSLNPPTASPDPVAEDLVSATATHPCPTCGDCVHPVQILESRRQLTLVNHRPWYKLAWPADQTIYFEDLVHLAACIQNRAARDPRGEWTIRGRVGAAIHTPTGPHECGRSMSDFSATFKLITSPSPDWRTDMIRRTTWEKQALVYRYDIPRLPPVLYFGWSSEGNINEGPCSCGKP